MAAEQESRNPLETEPIQRLILRYAVPTAMTLMVNCLYNIVDQIFVGQGVGITAMAAINVAFPVVILVNAVALLLGDGSAANISLCLGRRQQREADDTIGHALTLIAASGLCAAVVSWCFAPQIARLFGATDTAWPEAAAYLRTIAWGLPFQLMCPAFTAIIRADGHPRYSMGCMITGAVLNLILDPIFILPWGLNMGAAGAGLATFLSNCVACIYFFVLLYVRRKTTFVCILPRKFTMQKAIVLGVCGVGIPAAIQNLLNVTGMTILNNFTSAYGAQEVAAMGITQKINMVPLQVAMGFCQGIMPLISYNYASGNHKRMKETVSFTVKTLLPFLVAVSLGYYFGAGIMTRAFMDNDAIVAYGTRFLRGFCLGLPFMCMDFLAVGVFQAIGMGGAALSFAILRKIVLEIPALYLLNWLFPLYGLAYAQFTAEFVLAAAAVIMLARIFGKMQKEDRKKQSAGQTGQNLL